MTEREKQAQDMMREIMNEIKIRLPEGMGFTLLAYEFGENKKLLYASNTNREDVILMMLKFIDKNLDDPKLFRKDL